jgi:methionyl-tRNA formyltransferase
MILDGNGALYGGVTLHCLSSEPDMGDIIGSRRVPYDADRGFIHWNVCQARAAGDLVAKELQGYLGGALAPCPQSAEAGSYRKVHASEVTLSEAHSSDHIKWLCDQLGASGWIRFRRQNDNDISEIVTGFIRRVGPRSFGADQIGRFAIEFDAADGRVRVARRWSWTQLRKLMSYLVAIARTGRTNP